MLHPIDDFPIQGFLNGDVRHCGCRRGAVPMLLVRRKPDDIARPDFLDSSALALRPSKARSDNQCLTKGMCMPCRARARLQGDSLPRTRAGSGASNNGSIRTLPVNQSAGPRAEGCEAPLLISMSSYQLSTLSHQFINTMDTIRTSERTKSEPRHNGTKKVQ